MNIAPPNATVLPLPFPNIPFQALNTANNNAATPTLQNDTQTNIKICSPLPPKAEITKNKMDIASPTKKYFLFVKKYAFSKLFLSDFFNPFIALLSIA